MYVKNISQNRLYVRFSFPYRNDNEYTAPRIRHDAGHLVRERKTWRNSAASVVPSKCLPMSCARRHFTEIQRKKNIEELLH